jgi:hypothetical protein
MLLVKSKKFQLDLNVLYDSEIPVPQQKKVIFEFSFIQTDQVLVSGRHIDNNQELPSDSLYHDYYSHFRIKGIPVFRRKFYLSVIEILLKTKEETYDTQKGMILNTIPT